MNLRILKKLSKRAAPLVAVVIKDKDALFKADDCENFTNTGRHDRKHWERSRSIHNDLFYKKDIITKAKDGDGFIVLSRQWIHPWKNTDMVGWMVGYWEPEFEEETTWDWLREYVYATFFDCEPIPGTEDESGCPEIKWISRRRLKNPSDYFKAFADIQRGKTSE